ncbi:uncharacterized protein LOC111872491, partial [Cryptotermes secundus]|uniref:uncharacterized protein LOC111872491 n=1 Tax=Cryptotermes secundus TaxID=105785 RepID=UPI001454CD58
MELLQRNLFLVTCIVLILGLHADGGGGPTSRKGPRSPILGGDQSTASAWWQEDISSPGLQQQPSEIADNTNFFTSTHGLVQTHPLGGGGSDIFGQQPGLRTIDFGQRGLLELRRNPSLSSPEECARACREDEPPRICYYHFTLELYNVLGAACQVCTPNATNHVWSHCQCVLADGVERGILTVNRMLPGPSIQ